MKKGLKKLLSLIQKKGKLLKVVSNSKKGTIKVNKKARYVDMNKNGQYDPGIDVPGVKDAKQTIFACLTDGFPEEHTVGEGFGGGTPPMFAEVHLTAWSYNEVVLEDVQFFEFVIINKNRYAWDSTFMAIVADPDLGWSSDDYIG